MEFTTEEARKQCHKKVRINCYLHQKLARKVWKSQTFFFTFAPQSYQNFQYLL